MNALKLFFFATGLTILTACSTGNKQPEIQIIPQPAAMTQDKGRFVADSYTVIQIPEEQEQYTKMAQLLNINLGTYTGQEASIVTKPTAKNAIRFIINSAIIGEEAYQLKVNSKGVTIEAKNSTGLFYGLQTLLQMLDSRGIPYVSIYDEPRFQYRGLHLDVSRNFFPKEFVMKLMDLMALYKLNTFHWHLTDGAGWRIQLDTYPELTTEAAFRDKKNWKEWWNGDRHYAQKGSPEAYGGYYTKADVREVLAYAKERHITVIPEIEMPGHSEEVFVSHPELCCTGEPYTCSDFCVGNEETFTFIENVLKEIMDLFPSKYIHIGGDEAVKKAWKTCPKCQARMRTERLADVDELQSYFVRRIEKFLNENGRKLIGWDEILEGGLPPEATVMSWRGEDGGIRAAREGHDAVMTPGSYLYFDFYQADPETQPEAIGGYTPVKRVYSYEPVPDSLTEAEAIHILGVQANVWSEYIPDESHAEYMIFPRLLALAEVAWSPRKVRDWQTFKSRLNAHVKLLRSMGVNAFPLSYEIETTMEVDTIKKEIRVFMDAEKYPAEIHYTLDGSQPTQKSLRYDSAIVVKDSAHIVAAIFENGKMKGKATEKKVDYHRGIGKKITYNSSLYNGYMAGGKQALLDGYRGGLTYLDGRWQGYTNSLDAIVDMGEQTTIHKVSARFMQLTGPCVYQPGVVELYVSEDGQNFSFCDSIPTTVSPDESKLAFQNYVFTGNWNARYIQLKAKEVHDKNFIFVDEIVIW